MPVSPARRSAFEILMRVEQEDAYASELLHSAKLDPLSAEDRGLAQEIVMGVLRWRSRLDQEIAFHSFTPLGKLDAAVLTALRMGAYQLRHLDRVPRHAAVDESVEMVKSAGKASAAGLANAVLRKIAAGA
ncbi:MAG: transcription antitermination factor NusB, partial [Acidobacteriaceae bacterium]